MVEINELAVIFEPFIDEDKRLSFIPTDVAEGYYNEEYDRFIDKNLYSYSHLTLGELSKGYALRYPISQLLLKYPDKSLEEIKSIIFEEHCKYIYFLGMMNDELFIFQNDQENDNNTLIIDEDTIEHLVYLSNSDELTDEFKDLLLKGIGELQDNEEDISEKEETYEKIIPTQINPHQLYKEIRETVKGQDEAIKEIVTCIWKNINSSRSKNMLIVGPSGCGKTEILRLLANKLNIPLMITTVTGMSQAGYVGNGTDEILENLLIYTKGNVAQAENAIIVLDEIDKIAYGGVHSGKISTEGVQNELLKIVEDGDFYVTFTQNGVKSKEKINTSKITFIGVGAFDGIYTKTKEKSIGFNQDISSKEIKVEKISPEDLIDYGLKPELVGRMGKIVKLNELSLSAMKDIILHSDKSAYQSELKFLADYGITLKASKEDEIVEEIAKLAISKKIGARSIEGIITEMFTDIEYAISNSEEKYTSVEISKETVTNSKKYILKK